MVIEYSNKKVRELCTDHGYARRKLGAEDAESIWSILKFLESAESLKDLSIFKKNNLHKLTGDRKGQFALNLRKKSGRRLIFVPFPPLNTEEEKLDIQSQYKIIEGIRVLEVSNHYEQ
jgi:proteic killer suppression protein